ncbi:MAG: PKD domain-containing protein [Bacteroidales bacterium]|jgi:hypothetical protein|nr:PKD domain-containing protein [Bacteroidales bacterium]
MIKIGRLMILAVLLAFVSCKKDNKEEKELVNKIPVANAGTDQTVKISEAVTLDGSASSDEDNDALIYKWVVASNNPAGISLSANNVAKPTFTAPVTKGTYTFSLVVNDGKADSKSDDVVISVVENKVNTKPVANAGNDISINTGEKVELDGSGSSDPEGDNLTYKWSEESGNPEDITLTDSDKAKASFTAPNTAGDYVFNLVVNDGNVDSDVDKVTVTVKQSQTTTGPKVTYSKVPRDGVNLKSVAYGNNIFVAVGYYGNSFNNEDKGSINYSADGINWNEVATMSGGDSWHKVVFDGGKFIVSGDYGAITTSTNGKDWNKESTAEQRDWYSIAFNSSKYVFTSGAARFGVSDKADMMNVTVKKSNYNDDVWYSIVYGADKFVMVGNNGRAGYSTDGTDWTFKTIDKNNYTRFGAVAYGNSGYVATASVGSTYTAISTDGIDWTMRKNSISVQGVAYINNNYVLLGTYLKDKKVYISSDLDFATKESVDIDGDFRSVVFGNGKYIVVGNKTAVIEMK